MFAPMDGADLDRPGIDLFGVAGGGVLCFSLARGGFRHLHILGQFGDILVCVHSLETGSDKSATNRIIYQAYDGSNW